jgi:hypothetical protein
VTNELEVQGAKGGEFPFNGSFDHFYEGKRAVSSGIVCTG